MNISELDIDREMGAVSAVLPEREKKRGVLIHALHMIQEEKRYLPEEELKKLSAHLGIPLAEIYSVASFYKMFHFRPRGEKIVKVCLGTACFVRGARQLLQEVETTFGVRTGETTDDLAMTLETVGCVGCCGLAPVATINDEVFGEIIGAKRIAQFIRLIRNGRD